MAKKKKAALPMHWIIAAVVLLGIVLLAAIMTVRQLAHHTEPLADQTSLELLTNGIGLPEPTVERTGSFHGSPVTVPKLATLTKVSKILGVETRPMSDAGNKRIEVDLTNQRVYAYEGDAKVYEFVVSTGKWGRTPTGTFTIWTKVRSQKMSGGSRERGTYYYLPGVPWVMFFYNQDVAKMRGFSFHGTYWHDKFGTPQSHGCVNMRTEEAKILYDWATPIVTNEKAWSTPAKEDNPGTTVIIYGTAPTS